MGCGASSKDKNGQTPDKASQHAAGQLDFDNGEKFVMSTPDPGSSWTDAHMSRLDEEVRWLRGKLEQEKKEKQWLLARGDLVQTSSSSGSATGSSIAILAKPEEELAWLRRAFDAEKTEKAWMMARFEVLEIRLKSRSEECTDLRAQIIARQTGVQSLPAPRIPSQETYQPPASAPRIPPEPPMPAMAARVSAIAEESSTPNKVVMDPYSRLPGPLSAEQDLRSPGVSPGMPSLKERRKLKLSVDTGGGAAAKACQAATGNTPKLPAQAVNKAASCSTAAAPQAVDKVFGPNMDSPQNGSTPAPTPVKQSTFAANHPIEPMSPLLLRRKVDKFPASTQVVARLPVVVSQPEPQPQSLRVAAFKLNQLDDSVPASPKIPRRRSNDFDEVSRGRSKSNLAAMPEIEEKAEDHSSPGMPLRTKSTPVLSASLSKVTEDN